MGEFFTGTMQCDTDQSGSLQSVATVALSCSCWRLNYAFCCIHLSSEFQCFSVGRTTSQNCVFIWANFDSI